MSDTSAMAMHRALVEKIDTGLDECDVEACTCELGQAARALLAIAWLHCPGEWQRAILGKNGSTVTQLPDGVCQSCGNLYPCREITAIADELELHW